ncbi:MAG: nitrogen fixation protein NifH [Deltaproteobacteria bacterium]|nr:nitrogen fixation protein NifH [Deltaproteobacteria bacterium]
MSIKLGNLYNKTIQWLLEPDSNQPGVRYFTLRDLMDVSERDSELKKAQEAIMKSGPVPSILAEQTHDGYWERPGPGYTPKYTGTVWQLIFLAQFGAIGEDKRVQAACEYVISNTMASNGLFSMNGSPSGFIHCLSGNLIAALIDLGKFDDDRVKKSIENVAAFITGEGIDNKVEPGNNLCYYKSGTCGPLYKCANNQQLPCAWGAIKTLLAMGKIPLHNRSDTVKNAIKQSIAFLLKYDPALANYPSIYGDKPNSNWFKFGFPQGYMTDILQNVEALALVDCIHDPRLEAALRFIGSKQNDQGQWIMECKKRNKIWFQSDNQGQPSKWITLRALKIIKAVG